MRRLAARLAGLVVVSALAPGAQCTAPPSVTLDVGLPASLTGQARWIEVGVFPGACPTGAVLSAGLPPAGAVARIAFQPTSGSPPVLGTLSKGTYGFAGVARGADCSALATGCAQVNLTGATTVTVPLAPTAQPTGACAAGQACFDARCVPAATSPEAGPGAGCAMTLVGAGPLGDPIDAPVDVVSAPAAVDTGAGFLVAYREYDPGGGAARITVASIDASGALGLPPSTSLPGQCSGQDETDGVGLAFAGGSGVVVSARPACGGQPPGLDALALAQSGTVTRSAFTPALAGAPRLSPGHALSLSTSSSGWLAYLAGGAANVAVWSDLAPSGSPASIGGAGLQTLAEVAVTPQSVALLAGGAGAAGDSGPADPSLWVASGSAPGNLGAPAVFPGHWGAVSAAFTRTVVLADSSAAGQPVAWYALDPSPAAPLSATFPAPGAGTVSGGDVALRGDHALFALEQGAGLSVVVFDHASTKPTFLRSVAVSGDVRVPPVGNLRGGKVVIAASASQALVTWVTGTSLTAGERVGGWALYACAP